MEISFICTGRGKSRSPEHNSRLLTLPFRVGGEARCVGADRRQLPLRNLRAARHKDAWDERQVRWRRIRSQARRDWANGREGSWIRWAMGNFLMVTQDLAIQHWASAWMMVARRTSPMLNLRRDRLIVKKVTKAASWTWCAVRCRWMMSRWLSAVTVSRGYHNTRLVM